VSARVTLDLSEMNCLPKNNNVLRSANYSTMIGSAFVFGFNIIRFLPEFDRGCETTAKGDVL